MIINKFQGKTKDEAIELAKQEMGQNVVIMNVKEVPAKGLAGVLRMRPSMYEVTAAVEEKDKQAPEFDEKKPAAPIGRSGFTAVADEKIDFSTGPALVPASSVDDWKGALDEVSKIVENSGGALVKAAPVAAKAPENAVPPQPPLPAAEPVQKPASSGSTLIKAKAVVQATEKYATVNPPAKEPGDDAKSDYPRTKNDGYLRMIYNTLMENEVGEQHINMILDEVKKTLNDSSSVDYLISNIYQKMVLLLGKPAVIECGKKRPHVVFFIGPTGVGKTTTISKIAAKFTLEENKKVAFLTADTYRISAVEQLKTYANIMNVPVSVVYSPSELNSSVEKYSDHDLIFVDTAGFSHKNEEQKNDLRTLVSSLDEQYEKDVYLVLSATTKYKDLLDIADSYRDISEYKLIFTKLDETDTYGNILNLRLYTDSSISYAAIGQSVPDDIEVIDTQKIVKKLLGGQ